MAKAAVSISRIERMNYGIAAIVSVIGFVTQSHRAALGLTIGAVLACANFFVLRKLVIKWTTEAARGHASNAPYLMLPKIIGLMGAVAIAILLLPIDAIAFVIGYSIFLISIVIETLYSALVPSKQENPDG